MQKTEASITWNAWGETNPGRIRANNEDRILCEVERGIFVVADGMGGEAAGEVAAQQAIDFIKKRLHQETGTASRRLREAISGANNEIYRLAGRTLEWQGMACVLTAAIVEEGAFHIGHVGDSRLYMIHEGAIRKITSDHSPVGQKEDAGELTELEAMSHPRRNEVYRDVGSQSHNPDDADFIQYLQVPFDRDAAWVICSDGLSDMLASKDILNAVIENAGNPRDSACHLIEMANAAGGKDNVSVIVVEGDGFAAGTKRGGISKRSVPSTAAFGRWAFLLYGIVLGILAVSLWRSPENPSVKTPAAEPVRLPMVLNVEPGSQNYPTIARALQDAILGDRIEIADGEYEETIELKEGVVLTARSPGKAILHITRALPDAEAAISADGIKHAVIAGIVIKAEPAAGLSFGIRILDSTVDISNVEVSGAGRAGLMIEGDSSGVIAAGFFHGNAGPGIMMSGASTPSLVGNLIYDNGKSIARKSPGLYVMENSYPEVKRNVFSGNGSEPIRLQQQALKERMMDNLFVNADRKKAIVVERVKR